MRSVACDLVRHEECDGLVHFVPISKRGRDYSHVQESERPRDIRPVPCSCECHRSEIASAKPLPLQEVPA